MNKPLVSIIVAIYNAEKYLRRCVDSLINQTLTEIEILLINDGSTDNSGAICDEYAAKDNRIKVFHRTNHGVAATRQFGLEHCTGEYVIHCDPDDWVDLDMYEKMHHVAVQEQADMVICDYVEEYKDMSKKIINQEPSSLEPSKILNEFYDKIRGALWNKLIRSDCILKYNITFLEKIDIGEDVLFTCQLLQKPLKIAHCPNTFYHYDCVSNDLSYTKHISKENLYKKILFYNTWRNYATTDFLKSKITPDEIVCASMCIQTQAFNPKEFYHNFCHLKQTNIWKFHKVPFHMRLIVWSAIHINYHAAALLMTLKLWFRKTIKRQTNRS